MKKAIIIGATSGIGQEVAGILVQQGWRIGIAGRREEVLRSMQQANPQQIEIQHLDVTKEKCRITPYRTDRPIRRHGFIFPQLRRRLSEQEPRT